MKCAYSTAVLGLLLLGAGGLVACAPNMDPGKVMTPEERLQAEEMKAWEAEQARKKRGDDGSDFEGTDEPDAFDQKQAEMELKRASLSAATCADVVEQKDKRGTADINIVFSSDGSVKEATVGAPYNDGAIGDCILNAYKAVIVPPFNEDEYSMSWVLDLSGKKPEKDKETADLERKIFGGGDAEEDEKDGKKDGKKDAKGSKSKKK